MEQQTKKNKKEAKEKKSKDQKVEEEILKSLEGAKTPEEKFQMLLRKYVENERVSRRAAKKMEPIVREKENLQREYNKSVLMRDKLEAICREQQKLRKSEKNESMQMIREAEECRKERESRFLSSLNVINQQLYKTMEENNKFRQNNIEMNENFKYLAEQYQKHNEGVRIEYDLHRAMLSKLQEAAVIEKEILIEEKKIALEKLLYTQKMLKELSDREEDLTEQLNIYTSKYDDLQSSLQKSNDIIATYKVELEKMSKNSHKLEKESLEWKRKWERSNASLVERDEHAMRFIQQVEQLQKILRALQTECTHLHNVIKENNVEVPAMPALPPEPDEPLPTKPPITSVAEVMSKNCAELKQRLASLLNQMKVLNLKAGAEIAMENQETEEVIAPNETMPDLPLPQEDAQPAPSVEVNATPVAEPVDAAN